MAEGYNPVYMWLLCWDGQRVLRVYWRERSGCPDILLRRMRNLVEHYMSVLNNCVWKSTLNICISYDNYKVNHEMPGINEKLKSFQNYLCALGG
jgi:hypothetical protein